MNNEKYWEDAITKKAADKKGQELALFPVADVTENIRKRGRPADNTLPVPGTDEGGIGENPQAKTKQRWTMRKRNEIGGDGFSKIGKLFYNHVHDALKAIKSDKWKPLWIEFWKTEG